MSGTTQSLLLIADISGYTRFMRLHALSSSHAKQIIVRLLRLLIKVARPPLRVAELEGDAVFFYAPVKGGKVRVTAEGVKDQLLMFLTVFNQEVASLAKVTACLCDACVNVGALKLKQVLHAGEVAIETIDRFEKLFGVDVIVVHRLLKNSVPAHEYVMMTRPVLDGIEDFYGLTPERYVENCEGIGEVETHVFSEAQLAQAVRRHSIASPIPPLTNTLGWKFKMHMRTLLDLLRIKRIPGIFKNLPG